MNNKLPNKINDYTRYTTIANKHFLESLYSDAALNCRKASEAACKVIIYNAYSEKFADDKVEGCSLKELITLLIKNNLAERKVINWIESLQIIGNKAAHDNVVSYEEANYSITALNFLSDWLFADLLKINNPIDLIANIINVEISEKEISQPITDKIIIQEKLSAETEAQLIERVQTIINERSKEFDFKSKTDNDTFSTLKKSLDETNDKVNILSSKKKNVKLNISKKNILFSIIVLFIVAIGIIFLKSTSKHPQVLITKVYRHPDTVYVAINKFKVLQDNPNINFKIESILRSYIYQIAVKTNIPVKVIFTQFPQGDFINDTTVVNNAVKSGFDVLYSGNIYETAFADSNMIEISGSNCNNFEQTKRYHKIKFKNITDSTLIKEFNDQANITAFCFASKPDKLREGNKVLKQLNYYSIENYRYSLYIRSNNNWILKDLQEAMIAVNDALNTEGDNRTYLAYKASIFIETTNYDSAEVYAKKALQFDSINIALLTTLSQAYKAQAKDSLAFKTLLKILKYEPDNESANGNLLLMYFYGEKTSMAKNIAFKLHRTYPLNKNANFVLAELYSNSIQTADSAEYYYGLSLKTDSSFTQSLNGLGELYLKFYKNKSAVAKYLLKKAKAGSFSEDLSSTYNLAIVAFNEGDYKLSTNYFEKVYETGYLTSEMAGYLCAGYKQLNNFESAMFFAQKAMVLDSNRASTVYNYTILLSALYPKKINTVTYYFNKAIKLNPDYYEAKKQLALYLNNEKQYTACIAATLPLYRLHSQDTELNHFLADSYLGLNNNQSAVSYLEYLRIAEPKNADVLKKLSYAILLTNKSKEEFARGSVICKDAIRLNYNDADAHLIYALYMVSLSNVINSKDNTAHFKNCQRIAREEYAIARRLNPAIKQVDVEAFLKIIK